MKKHHDEPAKPLDKLFKEWRKNPKYVVAYEELASEYSLYESMIKALQEANITQKEVAKRMKTSEAAVSRLFDIKKNHAPSWNTIMKFADALGKRPVLNFVDAR